MRSARRGYTAVSPDRLLAYVTDSARHEIAVVDVRGRRVVGRVPVGGPCRHLGIDRAGTRLWTALGNKAERLAVLSLAEPRRPRLVSAIRPPFLAHDIGFTPGGRRVWVTSGDRGRMAIYDARRGELVRTIAADAPPQHVTFMGDRAFVTSGDDAVLRVHALDGRLLRSAPVPGGLLQRPARLGAGSFRPRCPRERCARSARAAPCCTSSASPAPPTTPASSSARDDDLRAHRPYSQRMAAGRDERAFVRAAQRGSASGIEALFRLHWPRAYRAAFLVVHDSGAAEDIAQESFLAAVRNLDRFDRRRPFGPWLHRIVVNRAIDWTRARHAARRDRAADVAAAPEHAGSSSTARCSPRSRPCRPSTAP